MIFFDWQKIRRQSNGNVQTIRTIFESMLNIPCKGVGRLRYDRMDFSGESYLLKPYKLLEVFQFGNQIEAANVIMLASYRNYAEYIITGDFHLPTKYVNIPTTKLEQNSLLFIEGNNIHFLTEK